jgi:hypothetical protein
MEEEVMNQEMPERQGMMGANVQPAPMQEEAPQVQSQLVEVLGDRVENNLQNLSEQEMGLITQLNIPQFRDFMSKVFGPEFGMLMEQELPQPQTQAQPVSQPSESPTPMTGEGMMTQPPVR